jgi:hypothetical protein
VNPLFVCAVIQSASGAGKTYASAASSNPCMAGCSTLFSTLKTNFSTSAKASIMSLSAGDGAGAPINEDTAGELARALLELGVSAILQLNDLGLAGQRRGGF